MAHATLAQLAAVVGAAGVLLVVLPRSRWALLAGFGLLAVAEAGLAVALVPGTDLGRLQHPSRAAAAAAGLVLIAALAWVFARRPVLVLPALLAVAPFRVPVQLGDQKAFLLLPIYLVAAAVAIGYLWRWLRGAAIRPLPPLLALPTAGFLAFDAVSLLWSQDLRHGSIELAFFIFPFAAVFALVARAPLADWLPRALAVIVVALACLFTAVGVWQASTHRIFFAHDLTVANAYTTYFRVTSMFHDPSLFGRWLVFGFAVIAVAMWLGKIPTWAAALSSAFLFAGLYLSYSQSSMVALAVVLLAVTLIAGDRTARRTIATASVLALVVGGAFVAVSARQDSARKVTSGRSRLVSTTVRVIRTHPLAGVGVGAQPQASHDEAKQRGVATKDASHTTPLTVAAELGVAGTLLYLAFLAGAARVLLAATQRRRALGLGLAAVFLGLVAHSLFYAGFFEDPMTLGSVALAAAVSVSEPVRAAVAASPSADDRGAEPGRRRARPLPR